MATSNASGMGSGQWKRKRPTSEAPDDEDIDQDDGPEMEMKKRFLLKKQEAINSPMSVQCPYLDTIDRNVLDFDFEKLCSVSLSRINVYACLVCGKYFQGRGQSTHAYTHSVSEGHRVYLNLETKKFYCLPDNYEIIDPSLSDILYVLNPTFNSDMIRRVDSSGREVRALGGTRYLPGVVGLNNIKANDYCNVVLQALSHVAPIRNFFLDEANYKGIKRPPGDISATLSQRFGELMRKLWNPRNFKAHVSPHEMLQAVVLCSKKNFQITAQGDAEQFLTWLINALHLALGGTKKANSSIVYRSFRGEMRIHTKKILPTDIEETKRAEMLETDEFQWKTTTSPFLHLTLELPAPPLFKDEIQENIIPQVSLFNVLAKFNGVTEKEYKTYKDNFLKKFEIIKLPPYIILYFKRFTKNTFFLEKNPTIINFPIKSVEFGDLVASEFKHLYPDNAVYDLMANVVHEGPPTGGIYKVHILHEGLTFLLRGALGLVRAAVFLWLRRSCSSLGISPQV
eukprot:maker-scaffold1179_size56971-snap-gene-0.16 protein:Tk06628 transcript:maker-scaffold1179_size56971-snap-gene-0.16-mRNA-1 annotation:"u4 tri-snrnp-associated protein 2-like"